MNTPDENSAVAKGSIPPVVTDEAAVKRCDPGEQLVLAVFQFDTVDVDTYKHESLPSEPASL